MLRPDPDDGGEGDFSTARVPHTQVAATAGNDTAWSSMAGWADGGVGGTRMRARMGDLEIYIWKVGVNPEVWVSGLTPEDLVSCAGP